MKRLPFLLLMFALFSCAPAEEEVSVVQLFEAPEGILPSNDVEAAVNEEDVFVYDTRVNHDHTWSWETPITTNPVVLFDFDNFAAVSLTYPNEITSVVIRPLALNVSASIDGNTVSFVLSEPRSYVVEVNGDVTQAVHIFTNYIDHDAPDPSNLPEDMIYYGPGVHQIGTVQLSSNDHVYIAGGAYLEGQFKGYNVSNVIIEGRGIISGESFVRDSEHWFIPYEFIQSDHLVLEGITILDPAGWAIHSNFNTDVLISRVNIITARQNGDGISLQSNHNVNVKYVFARTWDDSLVVKNYDNGTSSNIEFDEITIWTDLAQSMEIGYETNGASIDNVTFQNITVLHNFHKPVISIHNGDQAIISNITYRNIVIEDAQTIGDERYVLTDNLLIELAIVDHSIWSSSSTRGQIDGVLFDEIFIMDGRNDLRIRIAGYDDLHQISNVVFRNVTVLNEPISSTSNMVFVLDYTNNILFEHDEDSSE